MKRFTPNQNTGEDQQLNYPVGSERLRQEVQVVVSHHQCRTTLPYAKLAGKGHGSSGPNGWQGGPSLLP